MANEMQLFLKDYVETLTKCADGIDAGQFSALIDLIAQTYRGNRQIFVCGNGGSAATANHFACDFGKNAVRDPACRRFRILSLSDNVERITAFGNDVNFESIFSEQLKNLLNEGDLLLAISASGNSPDVLAACDYAHERNAKIASLAGFSGGALKEKSDLCIVAQLERYEQIEDLHMMVLHMVTCYFKEHPEILQ